MRVVIDCNVLVAAARSSEICRAAVESAAVEHIVILSDGILEEYEDVGARPKHRAYRIAMRALTERLVLAAEFVEPDKALFGLSDPDDEVYLKAAVAGMADALITGNHRHFVEERYAGVEILSPRAFIERTSPLRTTPAPRRPQG